MVDAIVEGTSSQPAKFRPREGMPRTPRDQWVQTHTLALILHNHTRNASDVSIVFSRLYDVDCILLQLSTSGCRILFPLGPLNGAGVRRRKSKAMTFLI